MRYSRHLVSLRTFGLAFAVALSPAFFQTPGEILGGCEGGNADLAELSVEVWGMETIAFDPAEIYYEVELWDGAEVAIIGAFPVEEDAQVWMNYATAVGAVGYMSGDVGGGQAMIELASGESTLTVTVKATEGKKKATEVVFIR